MEGPSVDGLPFHPFAAIDLAVSLSAASNGGRQMSAIARLAGRRVAPHTANRLRFEQLENRMMLSASTPRVTSVEVASTAWSTDFVNYLKTSNQGTVGYAIPLGSTAQSAALTWKNLDQIIIKFDQDV